MTTGGKGKRSAKGSARGTPPRRRDRSRHHGGADRDGRDSGQPEIRQDAQRSSGRKSAREKSHFGSAVSNCKARSHQKVEEQRMSDKPSPRPTPEQVAAAMTAKVSELQAQQQMQVVQLALQGGVPRLYANQFAIAQSASDIALVILTNGAPTGVLNLSYITAKSLLHDLSSAVDSYEKVTKRKVKTIDEISPDLAKIAQEKNAKKL
jgi:hypothetical protein